MDNSNTNEKEEYLFKATTKDGYTFKVLSELLKNKIKNCIFMFDPKGIFIKAADTKTKTLIKIKIYGGKFLTYKCKDQHSVGLNMMHLQKILKSIKKKDSLSMFIVKNNAGYILMNPLRIDSSAKTNNMLKIINIPFEDYSIPLGYKEDNDITLSSKDFQKVIKDLNSSSSKLVTISSKGDGLLRFYSSCGEMYCTDCTLGEKNDEYSGTGEIEYQQTFNSIDFSQLSKVSGLSNIIKFNYGDKKLPLKIVLCLSNNLVKLELYIKSNESLENEETSSIETNVSFEEER